MDQSRREFLRFAAVASFGLSFSRLTFAAGGSETAASATHTYNDWRDIYRKKWSWDKIVHSSHSCNCNNNCSWKVYVREGIVWREEQTAAYVQHNPGLSDFNPQGCQKGASYSHEMYRESRLRYPLKRIGKRGEGKWARVSWDEALTDIATKLVEIVRDDGHDTVVASLATHAMFPNKGGPAKARFVDLLGGTLLDNYGDIGDSQAGCMITTGVQSFSGSSDSRMRSKCIILWVYNPALTRIPDAHHLHEARYRGATIISISPDQNPSHMHADYWVNPRPGTDTALAMAMNHIIVRDKLYDVAFIKEQTDLPFLVREDTQKFLRAADLETGASDAVFLVWDTKTEQPQLVPGSLGSETKTLLLGDIDPALEGQWSVKLADGSTVKVSPVFERLKQTLASHTPEFAAEATGVGARTIEFIAKHYADAEPALIEMGWGIGKLYHGDLLARAIILMSALTGNTGKEGGGFWNGGIAALEGLEMMMVPTLMKTGRHRIVPGPSFMYVHGGLRAYSSRWIPTPGAKSGDDYIMEAIEKRWMPVYPAKDKEPRALIECGSNILRRTRMNHVLHANLWPKLKLVVTIDYRMTSTAQQSDYVLPAAGYYELEGIKASEQKVPHHVYQGKAVEPLAESRDEWYIFAMLSKKIQQLAPAMGVSQVKDEEFNYVRDYSRIYDDFTGNGQWKEDVDDSVLLEHLMRTTQALKDISLKQLREQGYADWTNAGNKHNPGSTTTFEVEKGKPLTPATDFTERKQPWRTLTGRQQFYIDHDWFIEFGEQLPVHRETPKMGGDYPLRFTGGHARWGIHSLWRDNPLMLRMQRGEPIIYANPDDAKARGIKDNDYVEVYNDVGSFQCRVMVTPTMQPGQIHHYQGWEAFQYRNGKTVAAVLATQLKPLQFVGNYGHLQYIPSYYQPNNVDRGTCVDMRAVTV